jgi:hypothetical protein
MKRKITINRVQPHSTWINEQQDFSFILNQVSNNKESLPLKRGWFGPTLAGICIILVLTFTRI